MKGRFFVFCFLFWLRIAILLWTHPALHIIRSTTGPCFCVFSIVSGVIYMKCNLGTTMAVWFRLTDTVLRTNEKEHTLWPGEPPNVYFHVGYRNFLQILLGRDGTWGQNIRNADLQNCCIYLMGAWGVPVLSCFSDFVSEVSVIDCFVLWSRQRYRYRFLSFSSEQPHSLRWYVTKQRPSYVLIFRGNTTLKYIRLFDTYPGVHAQEETGNADDYITNVFQLCFSFRWNATLKYVQSFDTYPCFLAQEC